MFVVILKLQNILFEQLKERLEAMKQLRSRAVFGRKLQEAFKGSLQHVNRIYNKMFGYTVRKIPAHISHMIDKDIMQELHEEYVLIYKNKIKAYLMV